MTSTDYTLDVRVFDDGVAYRHVIPGDPAAVRVPLTFLGSGGYSAVSVRDDSPDGATVKVETATHRSTGTIVLDLQAGGGFLVRLTPP